MRYLLISISVLLLSCSSYPKRNNFKPDPTTKTKLVNPYFSDSAKDYVYRADISLFKKDFSGIFIVKKIAENSYRVAFTTEMGNKIFDFSFSRDEFKVNYILAEMDKRIIINTLKNDFKTLISENPSCSSAFKKREETLFECQLYSSKHYYHAVDRHPHKIIRFRNGREKVRFLFMDTEGSQSKSIKITHKNIDLSIILKAI